MILQPGKTFLKSFVQQDITYNIIVSKVSDMVTVLWVQLIRGDWQVAEPEVLFNSGAMNVDPPLQDDLTVPALRQRVQVSVIDPFNTFLKSYFGGGVVVVPTNWIEAFELILKSIIIFRDANNVPQIKIQ